jgi:FdhD protein
VENIEITVISENHREKKEDFVTREVALTINLDGEELSTLLCSPGSLKELVTGFLFTSGIIRDTGNMSLLTVDRRRTTAHVQLDTDLPFRDYLNRRIYTSGCGRGVLFHNPLDVIRRKKIDSELRVEAGVVMANMRKFLRSSEEHRHTGGVHSCALMDGEDILVHMDDIGRHNALDKIVGAALMRGISLNDKALLTSGRISSEILSKVLQAGVPVIISRGAPSDQAVRIARMVNLTMVGFARRGRLNAYSGEERIT